MICWRRIYLKTQNFHFLWKIHASVSIVYKILTFRHILFWELTSLWKKNGANLFLLMSYEIGKKVRYNRLRAKKIFRWTGRAVHSCIIKFVASIYDANLYFSFKRENQYAIIHVRCQGMWKDDKRYLKCMFGHKYLLSFEYFSIRMKIAFENKKKLRW